MSRTRVQLHSRYHVIGLAGSVPSPMPGTPGDGIVPVGLDTVRVSKAWHIHKRVFGVLAGHGLTPTQAATDFYRFAATAYTADLRIPRASGFDHWTRDIVLHLPVADPEGWVRAREPLTLLLGFLTGDRWTLEFRHVAVPPEPVASRRRRGRNARATVARTIEVDAVCLLSGGLDSALGALNELASGRRLALASHNVKGDDAFSMGTQVAVVARLGRAFQDRAHHLQFRVDPPHPDWTTTISEPSQRSRSIIFFALGLLAASGLPGGTPLIIPENGLISLNVPLTSARLGSWSTRTTHPHTMALLRRALDEIGIPTPFETPYRFATKGEMLRDTSNSALAREIARLTISCAHPSAFRFEPELARRRRDLPHCGTCVPCLIRRASLSRVGWDDGRYRMDVIKEAGHPALEEDRGADLRAFRIAVARRELDGIDVAGLLRGGPLHVTTPEELRGLVRVVDEGILEIGRFLDGDAGWDPPRDS